MPWFQVFCKEIESNAVSKLFILVWHYEGMKVLDLGYENSYENFSITPICHIFSNFPAVFHHTQVTNRQVLKHGFTQLWRTAHIYDNRLERLHTNMFSDLRSLTMLNFWNNEISEVEPGAFIGLSSVTGSTFSYNRIRKVEPDTFRRLESLLELNLTDNPLTTLPAGVFNYLHRPQVLSLGSLKLLCNADLCWLKQEELQESIIWGYRDGITHCPKCRGGIDWDTWVCTEKGNVK